MIPSVQITLYINDKMASPEKVNRIKWGDTIRVTYITTTSSLNYVACLITPESMPVGVDSGELVYRNVGSIQSNYLYSFEFQVDKEYFCYGNTLYNCGLYCRDATDGKWNEYLCFSTTASSSESEEGFLLKTLEGYSLVDEEDDMDVSVEFLKYIADGEQYCVVDIQQPEDIIILDKFTIQNILPSGYTASSVTGIDVQFGE